MAIDQNKIISSAFAKGLIETGIEGGYDSISKSNNGDYLSIGCSQWEGGRENPILHAAGGSKFIGLPFSSLTPALREELESLLSSQASIDAQHQLMASDCNEKYIPEINKITVINDIRCKIYTTMWMPTSTYVVAKFIDNRKDRVNVNDLAALFLMFQSEYNIAAGFSDDANVTKAYYERAKTIYDYCAALDLTDEGIKNFEASAATTLQIAKNAKVGRITPADNGVKNRPEPHGKHSDSHFYAIPENKTYCEPIFPDLVSVSNEIPEYVITTVNIPLSEVEIHENMYYTIPVSTLIKYCGPDSYKFQQLNEKIAEQRHKIFDPEKHRNDFKIPSSGKPANNNDPFPTDLKIEELELHQPRCKISEIKTCPEGAPAAKAVIQLSMDTEKRIVRLENNMATLMRYFYRLSSRVHINCVYYGGQATYEKYKCIRCLKDDRLSDGQMMSIDQCLNCTRYEPIIGQVYDILNDAAVNLSQILDDNQMSYTTMPEYCQFTSKKERQQEMVSASMDSANIKIKTENEYEFKDIWPVGVKMDWNLVPVEEQKPHINWQQSINDPGPAGKLSSYFGAEVNYGRAVTGGAASNRIISNKNLMDKVITESNSVDQDKKHKAYDIIIDSQSYATEKIDTLVQNVENYLQKEINTAIEAKNKNNLDSLLIAAIMQVSGESVEQTIDKLSKIEEELKTKSVENIILALTFYNQDMVNLFGKNNDNKSLPVRLDMVTKIVETTDTENGTTTNEIGFGLNWSEVNSWDWINFIEPLNINITKNKKSPNLRSSLDFLSKVAYLYSDLVAKCNTSRLDGNGYAFPIHEENIPGMTVTSWFGYRYHPIDGEYKGHRGVDLAVETGTPVYAMENGIIIMSSFDTGGGGNVVQIDHGNGLSSLYMHNDKLIVKLGDSVAKGQLLSYSGNTGGSTGPHLHFEIRINGNSVDPCSAEFFPDLINY